MFNFQTKGLPTFQLKRQRDRIDEQITRQEQEEVNRKKAREAAMLARSGTVLVPASPPKEKARQQESSNGSISPSKKARLDPKKGAFESIPVKATQASNSNAIIPPSRPQSSFLTSLPQAVKAVSNANRWESVDRSISFHSNSLKPNFDDGKGAGAKAEGTICDKDRAEGMRTTSAEKKSTRRETDLTVVEDLTMGPKEFGKDPSGSDLWESVEPNTGIRLAKRTYSHDLLQAHLSDRYHVPPSLLYSIVRLSRDGTFYHVPLDGDFVIIAVVAEQIGGIKTTKAGPSIGGELSSDEEESEKKENRSRTDSMATRKKKTERKEQRVKKFVSFKLTQLPPRGSTVGAASGDATLTLLMFESDSSNLVAGGSGGNAEVAGNGGDNYAKRVYRGGSGGAFEEFWKLKVGTVIAILNPKILRPLKNSQSPHPMTNALAINPLSAESVIEIGQARDLGRCASLKIDGERCLNWVDKRVGEVCEYHVHAAMKRNRASRAEFGASTSTFAIGTRPVSYATQGNGAGNTAKRTLTRSTSFPSTFPSSQKRPLGSSSSNTTYDPIRKTGLLPRDTISSSSSASFVVNGHVVHPGRQRDPSATFGPEFTHEKIGRHKEGLLKRQREERESEKEIVDLLGRDGGKTQGGRFLEAARRQAEAAGEGNNKAEERRTTEGKLKDIEKKKELSEELIEVKKRKKNAFSAEMIKHIGFDPTVLASGNVRGDETAEEKKRRLEAISLLAGIDPVSRTISKPEPQLGPVPGRKVRGWSSVRAPTESSKVADSAAKIGEAVKEGSKTEVTKERKTPKYVDLSSSDVELD
ncbi:Protein required for S-phase initiation or completion [Phaffia rhodozyma]|uniref:Protein required for S-phase initiation or completion n=1 Tax=Phaffia rhodozyma TaxID=264483 RepID=A0A0F7SX96_PHARH|nr:Protein required for S-phase initiation or completion [Phaffia rhodozyma]